MPDRVTEIAADTALTRGASSLTQADATNPSRTPLPAIPTAGSFVSFGDKIYSAVLLLAALSIFIIIILLAVNLASASSESIQHFGFHYVTGTDWDETQNVYGILPFIFGTLYSSFIALLLAVPVSIGAAIFLSELAPRWIRTPMTFLIELLAAIPSVVYGLWGIFILLPFLKAVIMKPVANSGLPKVPLIGKLFEGDPIGPSMLAAGVILAIMVVPFITAVTRDILKAIPKAQREGSYGLGATWWETTNSVVLPYARSGIIGAVILGLGRALGETMAVTMVIGNQAPASGISWSVFDPGYTMSSALANKFNEASPGISTAALVEIGFVLFIVTVIVNAFARLLVYYTAKDVQGRK